MKENIISQAAEAIIIKKENEIIKRRIKKSYRIKELDEKMITIYNNQLTKV
jgi:tRNA A-37 threonylcarbamoyl transferase component Bud32